MSSDKYNHNLVEDKIYSELNNDQKIKFNKNLQNLNINISKAV